MLEKKTCNGLIREEENIQFSALLLNGRSTYSAAGKTFPIEMKLCLTI